MVFNEMSKKWSGLQMVLTCIILILSIFIFPKNTFLHLSGLQLGLVISSLSGLGLLISLIKQSNHIFTIIDACLIFNICYTAISIYWANNVHFVLYGLYSSIFLYTSFILFRQQLQNLIFKKLAYFIITTSLIYCIGLEYLMTYSDYVPFVGSDSLIHQVNKLTGKNFNYISSLIIVLFPFFLIPSFKYDLLIKLLVSVLALFIIYQSDSAFAFLVLLAFTLYYFASFFLTKKQLILSSVGVLLLGTFLIGLQGKKTKKQSYVIREFFNQNDRIQMSKNNVYYFLENPLLGCGRNNWSTTVSQYGYNDFVYNKTKTTFFNRFKHAHNIFFEKLSELGLIGLLPYLLIIGSLFKYLLLDKQNTWKNFELAAIASLINFITLSMMYGVVYCHADDIRILTMMSMFTLAILTKNYPKLNISNRYLSFGLLISTVIILCLSIHFFYTTISNNEIIKTAQYHKGKKDFEKANSTLDKISNISQRADILFLKGSIARSQEDYEKAIDCYYKAIQIDPYNINYLLPYGNILYKMELYADALEISEYIKELQDSYIPNKILMVKALYMNGNKTKSKTLGIELKKSMELTQKGMVKRKEKMQSKNYATNQRFLKTFKQRKTLLNQLESFMERNFD